MARIINFEGRSISVPDDATDSEVAEIIGANTGAPATPKVEKKKSYRDAEFMGVPLFTPAQPGGLRNLLGGVANIPMSLVERFGGPSREEAMVDKDSLAYGVGSFLDPVAQMIGSKAFQAAKAIPKLSGPIASGTAGGAGTGVAINTLTGDDPASGAIAGGVLGGLFGTGARAYNALGGGKSVGREYLQSIGIDIPAARRAAQATQPIVPGEAPTALSVAPALGSQGGSELAKLFTEVSKVPGQASKFSAIDKQNEAARMAALQLFAKDPATLEAAINRRGAIAEQLYGKVARDVIPEDNVLRTIVDSPAGPQIVNAAKKSSDLAQSAARAEVLSGTPNAARPIPFGTPRIPAQPSPIIGPSGQPISIIPEQPATYTVDALQKMKMALDRAIKEPSARAEFGLDGFDTGQLIRLQNQLTGWIKNKSTGWQAARDVFKRESGPINEMQVMQQLQSQLSSPLAGERATQFANAMTNAPRTIQNATGRGLLTSFDQAVSPQAKQAAERVLSSLQRQEAAEKMASGVNTVGATKASEVADSASSSIKQMLSGYLSRPATIAKKLAGINLSQIDKRVFNDLTKAMQSPQALDAYLASLDAPTTQVVSKLAKIINSTPQVATSGFMNQ